MLESLLFGLAVLVAGGLALMAFLLLPILLIVLLFKLLVFLIVLPFRVFGAIAGAVGAAFGAVAKLLLAVAGIAFGLLILAGGILVIPLVPLLLLGALFWIVLRAVRPRRSSRPASQVQIETRPA